MLSKKRSKKESSIISEKNKMNGKIIENKKKGDVVIFSHGGPIKAAIAHAIKADPSYTLPFWVDNLSLSRFDFIDGVCRVRFVNLLPKIISNSSNAYERFL